VYYCYRTGLDDFTRSFVGLVKVEIKTVRRASDSAGKADDISDLERERRFVFKNPRGTVTVDGKVQLQILKRCHRATKQKLSRTNIVIRRLCRG